MYQYIYYHNSFPSIALTISADNKKHADAVLHNAGLLKQFIFVERVKN